MTNLTLTTNSIEEVARAIEQLQRERAALREYMQEQFDENCEIFYTLHVDGDETSIKHQKPGFVYSYANLYYCGHDVEVLKIRRVGTGWSGEILESNHYEPRDNFGGLTELR